MAGKTDDLAVFERSLQVGSGGRGRRSPVYRWLFKNADKFQRILDDTQPRWGSVAVALGNIPVLDGAGNLPTAECVRKAWQAVKKDRRQRLTPLQKPVQAAVAAPVPPPSAAVPAAYYPAADEDEGEFVLRTLSRPTKRG